MHTWTLKSPYDRHNIYAWNKHQDAVIQKGQAEGDLGEQHKAFKESSCQFLVMWRPAGY